MRLFSFYGVQSDGHHPAKFTVLHFGTLRALDTARTQPIIPGRVRSRPRKAGVIDVEEIRQLLRRLARRHRQTSPQSVPHTRRGNCAHRGNARLRSPRPPSTPVTATIAQAAAEYIRAQAHNPNTKAALASLIEDFGSLPPAQLTADHIQRAAAAWKNSSFAQHTRSTYSKCLRRFIRWLERIGAAPATVSDAVPKIHQPQPRTTIATDEERRQLLEAANPALRFFLLLCADLGLRHRTAASISISNYNPDLRALSFYTKGHVHQTLPVTAQIAAVIESLPRDADRLSPIVNLLRRAHRPGNRPGEKPRFTKQWKALKKRAGIRPDLRIHDLRRTLAEDVWNATHDLRAVQAQLGHRSPTTTARYLADRITLQDLKPILRKVEQLRAIRETHPAIITDTGACNTCPAHPFCKPDARLCMRDHTQTDT